MFVPFSRARLDKLLHVHHISAAGIAYIEESLAKPSRNVAGTPHNLVSAIPNAKMRMTTQSESKTGERPHILEKTFDDSCIGFVTQPPAIELHYKGRNNKTVRTHYTPDCIAFYHELGIVVEEWKPGNERYKLEELYPGKYRLGTNDIYGSDAADAVYVPMGISFRLRFSDEINEIAHRNRQFLHTYLQPAAEAKYLSLFPQIRRFFADQPQFSIGELVNAGADRDVIYWALATGRMFFDIESVPLATQASLAQVFQNESTYQAWHLAVRPDGSRPRPEYLSACHRLEAGDVLMMDGRRLTVRFSGNTGIVAHDDSGAPHHLDFTTLEAAMLAGKLTLPTKHGQQRVRSRFYTAGPAALSRAISCAELLQRVERSEPVAPEKHFSNSTLRRWRKKVRDGEAKGWSTVESLIDEIPNRGFHGPHIDAGLDKKLDADITAALSAKIKKSKLAIFGDIEKAWSADGLKMVARSTFYEHVKKVQSPITIRASEGHKAAHQIDPAFWILDERTPVHVEHAMGWLHIDSTLLDVEVRSSLSGEVLGRPWLTLAICAATRRVMGFHLSFRPPSYVSSMMVLSDVIRRTSRLPDAVIHDWGSEFKARDFKECLAALFIERIVRPKGSPRFGSVIERMFGIATRQLIDNIAGNTKARKNVRTLSPSVNPNLHSGLWLLDLYIGLEEFFFGIYNSKKHPTTLQIPDVALETSLIMQGRRLHRIRRLEEILPIISPTARGSTRMLDPARGLYVNYRHYSNPVLTSYEHKDKNLIVKPVPFDLGLVLAFFRGRWIACRTPLTSEVTNSPEVVRRCLYEEWSIEQQLVASSSNEARKKLVDLIDDLNKRALSNQAYWAERKYQNILRSDVFPSAPTPNDRCESESQVERLMASMSAAVQTALVSGSAGRLVV